MRRWKCTQVARCFLILAMFTSRVAFGASTAEQALFQMTNRARADQGLPPLMWDEALGKAAAAHAEWIVQNSQLSHQYAGEADLTARAAQAGVHFQTIAENIAMGQSADSIQTQWMHSAPHRSNILDPTLNTIGFAVVERGGSLYAVADFARSVPSLTPEEAEATVAKLLMSRGVLVSGPPQDARQTCEMNHGVAGGSDPGFVMRWQSSDLSQLPPALLDKLQTGRYRTAAVGACSSANAESGFTSYRVAVLLY